MHDSVDALKWVFAHATDFGADSEKLAGTWWTRYAAWLVYGGSIILICSPLGYLEISVALLHNTPPLALNISLLIPSLSVSGISAGGHLAAVLSIYAARGMEGVPSIAAAYLAAPVTDVSLAQPSHRFVADDRKVGTTKV